MKSKDVELLERLYRARIAAKAEGFMFTAEALDLLFVRLRNQLQSNGSGQAGNKFGNDAGGLEEDRSVKAVLT